MLNGWIKQLSKIGACKDALEWGKDYSTLQEAWDKCERGDWMLWLLGKLSSNRKSPERKKLVIISCQCARLALKYVKQGEARPLKAIELAEAWAGGDNSITKEDLRKAADAAADAADAYASYAADAADAYASYAAAAAADAYASYAADVAAAAADAYASYAAADAADAADAYASYAAADAAASYAARLSVLKQCADIVRKYYPEAPELK